MDEEIVMNEDFLIDLEMDESEADTLSSLLQIASLDTASISEVKVKSKFKQKYQYITTQNRWYQNYSVDTEYASWNKPKFSKQDSKPVSEENPKYEDYEEISALEFINWIKGTNGQDCRPKIFDNITKKYLMFDTGAMSSCLPKQEGDKINRNLVLKTADGKPMNTYGYRPLTVRIGRKEYQIQAVVTDVKQPIIGMDLIKFYKLGFDWDGDEMFVVDRHKFDKN